LENGLEELYKYPIWWVNFVFILVALGALGMSYVQGVHEAASERKYDDM